MDLAATFKPLVSFRSSQPEIVGGGFFGNLFSGSITKNGTAVTNKSALTLSAFYNAIDIITTDFAKLPRHVYKKTPDGAENQSNHPVQSLYSLAPNQYMTPFNYNKVLLMNAILKGNGYAFIQRNSYTSEPEALQLINQDKTPVEVVKSNDKLYYIISGKTYKSEDIYHITGFSLNGITGIGVVAFAAHSLGISLSSQEFATDYYGTKGVGTAVVTTSKSMKDEVKSAYGKAVGSTLDRAGNWKVAVIDEASTFNHLKITPQEAEFLQTSKFGIEEVARWLNIPPHKLKSLENSNNSISENQELMYLGDSVVPWAVRGEQEDKRKLFTQKEVETGYYVKYNEGALLRADKKTQADYFSKLVYAGIMTRNEVRSLLDMNTLEGLSDPLTPVNTALMTQTEIEIDQLKNQDNG